MWTSNFIVVMSTVLLSSVTAGAAGWEGSATLKSAAVAVRRVFDRHGRIAHYSNNCSSSNTMAFTRSSSAISADKGVRVVDPSVIDVSDLKAEAAECSSVKTAGIKPREQSVFQDTVNNVLHTVRGFFVDAKIGTVALWTNFQTSQDIRRRVKGGHELTYAEYAHLERGANDRRKLLQFAVIYAVSPQTFPYIVLYAPSLLPSTFEKPHAVRAKYKRSAHERIAATLMGLSELERQLLEADAKFKGKPRKPESRQTKGIEALEAQRQDMLKILNVDSKKRAFELLQEHMVAMMTEPPAIDEAQRGGTGNGKQKKKGKGTKNKNTLPKACEGLPNPAIKALGKGMRLAGWRGIAPGFYVRYMLNDYVKELGRKDEVLRRQPLESLSDFDLREACNARAIDVADDGRGRDMTALRNSLAEWLELTSIGGVANREAGPNVVFLPDRARLLGLGLNFLENAKTSQCGELQRRAMLSRW